MNDSFPKLSTTPSYVRIRQRFDTIAVGDESVDVGHLVLSVLLEESLGGRCLQTLGVDVARIRDGCFGRAVAEVCDSLLQTNRPTTQSFTAVRGGENPALNPAEAPLWLRRIHDRALIIARRTHNAGEIASHHLVQAMMEVDGPARWQLSELGVTLDSVLAEISRDANVDVIPLHVDFELAPPDPVSVQVPVALATAGFDVNRPPGVATVIDANLNRAREGLRVLEDYARFVVNDEKTARALKEARHRLVKSELALQHRTGALLPHRNVDNDVGSTITTDSELQRDTVSDIVAANARRVQEALRSLEEFGKTLCRTFAQEMKQLRYSMYKQEQQLSQIVAVPLGLRAERVRRLHTSRLYVLLTESLCRGPWKDTLAAALRGGADVIQLREKNLSDAEIVSRGRWIAAACAEAGALFILNDRCDLAAAAEAHGVHIGQEDGSIRTARTQLEMEQLLGVSVHDRQQLQTACDAEADYLGIGPVFVSQTKQFEHFPGLDLVRSAAAAATRPWFAIGGINSNNVQQVCAAGGRCIAVSSAVIGAADPRTAAGELRSALVSAGPTDLPTYVGQREASE